MPSERQKNQIGAWAWYVSALIHTFTWWQYHQVFNLVFILIGAAQFVYFWRRASHA